MHHTMSVEDEIIVVRLSGAFSREGCDASRQETAELARRQGLRRILVDLSELTTNVPVYDVFDLCASHGKVLPPGARLALVYSPATLPAEDADFGETVAVNRAFGMRVFTDLEPAMAWLQDRAKSR